MAEAATGMRVSADQVFTGVQGATSAPGTLSIREGRIEAVEPVPSESANSPYTPGRREIHYSDATIIPGLVDAHAHITLAGDGRTYEQMTSDPDEMMSLIAVSNMRKHLACGVTTLRDNGGRNKVTFVVREAIERGYIHGPRLLLSGRPVTHSLGHFHWANGEADGEVGIRRAVRELVAEGADHIKIMASGGSTAGNFPYYASYNIDELRWAVETAHELGRLTTAHARSKSSMEYALEAGLDCIEHAEFLVPGKMTKYGNGLTSSGPVDYDPTLANKIIDAGMYISLTLQQGGYEKLKLLRDTKSGLDSNGLSQLDGLEERFDTKLSTMSLLLESGAQSRLVVSSDAGPYGTEFGRMDLGYELAIAGGLKPADALAAMTRIAADACGMSDHIGTLEAGKVADFFVVAGDPLTTPHDLRNVLAVYKGGRLVHENTDAHILGGRTYE